MSMSSVVPADGLFQTADKDLVLSALLVVFLLNWESMEMSSEQVWREGGWAKLDKEREEKSHDD